jgi:hypothetical protein
MQKLIDPKYMAFPFRLQDDGVETVNRVEHIKQIIQQVLFTNPNERVFRLTFGAGARRMVFEPNGAALWDLAKQRVIANLAEALRGEVDPTSLDVKVDNQGDAGTGADDLGVLYIRISYRLSTINREESLLIPIEGGSLG